MRLEGKVTVITGAAQGIGLACAKRFAAEGARVVMGDVQGDKGNTAAQAIRDTGGEAIFRACDVGEKAQVESLVGTAVDEWGRLDCAISNAAILHACDVLELTEQDLDRVLRVNLKGMFFTAQAAARRMVEQDEGGSIIFMSSVQAILAIPNILSYVVAKGGVNQMMRVMALALADRKVRVNAIGPGTISTDLARQVMTDDAARHKIMSRTPMGRLGDPDEVATVAMFLASGDSSYVTGQCIYCDGGRLPLNYTVAVAD